MDHFYMEMALKEARKGLEQEEVPVGAVLVYRGEVIASAHNQVESLQDATAHAEVLSLREGMRKLGNWRLKEAILYSTLEPCLMCSGAIILCRLGRLVWGAIDLRHGLQSLRGERDYLATHPIHRVCVTRGVLEEESASLLQQFFRRRRLGRTIE